MFLNKEERPSLNICQRAAVAILIMLLFDLQIIYGVAVAICWRRGERQNGAPGIIYKRQANAAGLRYPG